MSKVKLVVGPPGAGKSTYATEQAEKTGGLVIDLDQYRALAPDEDTAQRWRMEAEGKARDLGKDVFVVRTLAKAEERAEAAERIGADEVVVLLTSAEVSKARVSARDGDDSKHEVIDAWWKDYQARDGETTIAFDEEAPEPQAENEAEPESQSEPEPVLEEVAQESADDESEDNFQDKLDAAISAEKLKLQTERFNLHLEVFAERYRLTPDALKQLQETLNPQAFADDKGAFEASKLQKLFETAFAKPTSATVENHAGHRGTQPTGGKAYGKALAEEYLKKKG